MPETVSPCAISRALTREAGALFKVMREFDANNVNIIEIYHQRIFTSLPAKGLITDIECEARDRSQIDALVQALHDKGYTVEAVELA